MHLRYKRPIHRGLQNAVNIQILIIMRQALVAYFKAEKGFGFIKPEHVAPDVFFHISNAAEDLEELRQGDRAYEERISARNGKPEAIVAELIERN